VVGARKAATMSETNSALVNERGSGRPALTSEQRRGIVGNIFIWLLIAIIGPAIVMLFLRRWISTSPKDLDIRQWLPREAIQLVGLLIGSWVIAKREGVRLGEYGLPGRGAFGGKFWEGAIWGFGALSAVVGALIALAYFRIDSVALTGSTALLYALGWGVTFTVLAMWEEFFFRGYLLYRLGTRIGFWTAAVLMSLSFGIAHMGNPGENVLGIVQVIVFGLFGCFVLRRTGSLWFPIGYHAAWDWAQTYFFGTPDSGLIGIGHYLNSSASGPSWIAGGTGGPEASVFSLVVLALSALYVHVRFPRAQFPLYETAEFERVLTSVSAEPSN
jgi:membrane protease YdiL (CAAX protease family)